jgi:hypothetical protein
VQHCGVANVIAHKLAELKRAGIAAGDKMLNWMALNFGEHVACHPVQQVCIPTINLAGVFCTA